MWRGLAPWRWKGNDSSSTRSYNYVDPSKGWQKYDSNCQVAIKTELHNEIISESARQFCQSALYRLCDVLKAKGLDSESLSVVCLRVEGVLKITRKYLNGYIAWDESGRKPVQMYEILKNMSVMLFGSLTSPKIEKSIESFGVFNCQVTSIRRVKFISKHIMVYQTTGKGEMNEESWNCQRDATQRLTSFEKSAYQMSSTIRLNPKKAFLSLDDDLYGLGSREKQSKMLSARNADEEGILQKQSVISSSE